MTVQYRREGDDSTVQEGGRWQYSTGGREMTVQYRREGDGSTVHRTSHLFPATVSTAVYI